MQQLMIVRARMALLSITANSSAPLSPSVSSTLNLARWAAALMVLLYHLRINVLVDPQVNPVAYSGPWGRLLYLTTMAGDQAVIWFFVISGFLVGGSVISQLQRAKFTFENYALHRASRLYVVLLPALLIGLALDSIRIAAFGMSAGPAAGGESAASYTFATFLANVFFLQTLVAPEFGSNNALWSLANEAWYYIVFPLLIAPFMFRLSRFKRIALFLSAIMILAAGLYANKLMVSLFAVWLVGVVVRLLPFRIFTSVPAAWLLAVVVALGYPLLKHQFPGASVLPALTFANVLLTAKHEKRKPNHQIAAFNARLADFSFSLYVVHSPMLHLILTMLTHRANPRIELPVGWGSLALILGLLLILCLYAWSYSLLTERNTDKVRRWLAGWRDILRNPAALESEPRQS